MSHPLFTYFHSNRNPAERHLVSSTIAAVKQYPGAQSVSLPTPKPGVNTFTHLADARTSGRNFAGTELSVSDISTILYWSMCESVPHNQTDVTDFVRRPYPSGGAKFPIEAYLLTDSHPELGTAGHHYRPDTHVLERVAGLSQEQMQVIKKGYGYKFVSDIPVLLVFSYIRERNVPKYGYFGEKLALLEAGHIGQNIVMMAIDCAVHVTPLAGGDYVYIDSLLELDSYNESTFYTIGFGKATNEDTHNSDAV